MCGREYDSDEKLKDITNITSDKVYFQGRGGSLDRSHVGGQFCSKTVSLDGVVIGILFSRGGLLTEGPERGGSVSTQECRRH